MGGATAEVMCEALGVSVGFIVTQEKSVLLWQLEPARTRSTHHAPHAMQHFSDMIL